MADILAESPVENLPAGEGKRRKGRPRKQRIEDVANAAAAVAAPSLPLQAEEVRAAIKQAVTEAVKKPPAPDPNSPKGIAGLEKEIKRAATKRKIRDELKRSGTGDLSPSADEAIEETIAQQSVETIRRDVAHERPPHWWILRMR